MAGFVATNGTKNDPLSHQLQATFVDRVSIIMIIVLCSLHKAVSATYNTYVRYIYPRHDQDRQLAKESWLRVLSCPLLIIVIDLEY